ncbi:MAG: hypothetical protein H0W02_09695 [Ktedonobacteraceae bacterium]|nr:hypothetical protein [Ktedonobacteraceae bacterium]
MNNYPFEPGKQNPQGPYQPGNPYTPSQPQPQPPAYQPGNPYTPSQPPAYQPSDPYTPSQPQPPAYQPANPYAPQPPPAYQPTDPYTPSRPSAYPSAGPYAPPPPMKPQSKRNRAPLIVAIVAALVIIGSIGVFAIRGATGAASTPTPTAISVHYPAAASAYSGSVHNLSSNRDANMALTSVVQDQGKINGDIKFGLPLIGSGTFTGTVSSKGAVRFTVTSRDNGNVTLTFTGTLVAHGPMQGTYTANNGQHGTWKAEPATSPVIYPVLSQRYTGSFHNSSTGKDGNITLQVITQDQKNFTGTFLSVDPVNGTVGSDNSIQFAITDGKGGQIKFNGTVNIDGSLSGTYTATAGGTGTWKMSPAP